MITYMFPPEIPERITSKLTVEQCSERVTTPCWVWHGARTHGGYAVGWLMESSGALHRSMYRLLVGPIPDETLDHLCLVKACVNPEHLEPVSYRENKLRGMALRTECKYGHPMDGVRTRPNGVTSRYCLTCQARFQREARARKKARS